MDRGALIGLALAASLLAAGPVSADPASGRQEELLYRLRQDCGSCHGMTMKGGLGPPLLPAGLAERSDDELIAVILDGLPGTPMPPWAFEIDPDEAAWLVRRLKEGKLDAAR
jgi:cytochrome c55X